MRCGRRLYLIGDDIARESHAGCKSNCYDPTSCLDYLQSYASKISCHGTSGLLLAGAIAVTITISIAVTVDLVPCTDLGHDCTEQFGAGHPQAR